MANTIIGKCLLLEILNELHMMQVDLSILTGIDKSQINDYCHNRSITSINNAKLIVTALKNKKPNIIIDDLYDWKYRI